MRIIKKRLLLPALAVALLVTAVACAGGEQGKREPDTPIEGNDLQQPEKGAGLGTGTGNANEDTAGPGTETGESADTEKALEMTAEAAYSIVLKSCAGEFAAGYPVDESFLSWVTETFGEDSLIAFARTVENGQMDSELWYQQTGNSIHVLWDTYCKETGFQSERLERVYWKECGSREQIVLDFIGDVGFPEGKSTTRHLDEQANGIFDCFSQTLLEELTGTEYPSFTAWEISGSTARNRIPESRSL